MKPYYKLKDIPDPFLDNDLSIFAEKNFINEKFLILPKDRLNNELLYFFQNNEIKLLDCICWKWTLVLKNDIHTDGDYFGMKKRTCGMNWNFDAVTSVDFFDFSQGQPRPQHNSKKDFSTAWIYNNDIQPIDRWQGRGPVVLNPQVPHRINFKDSTLRRSVTLRFDESYQSLCRKLRNYIIE